MNCFLLHRLDLPRNWFDASARWPRCFLRIIHCSPRTSRVVCYKSSFVHRVNLRDRICENDSNFKIRLISRKSKKCVLNKLSKLAQDEMDNFRPFQSFEGNSEANWRFKNIHRLTQLGICTICNYELYLGKLCFRETCTITSPQHPMV